MQISDKVCYKPYSATKKQPSCKCFNIDRAIKRVVWEVHYTLQTVGSLKKEQLVVFIGGTKSSGNLPCYSRIDISFSCSSS